jgi:serine O-acetyltransferase
MKNNLKEILEYIKSDLHRIRGNHSLKSFVICFIRNRSFRFLIFFRFSNHKNFVIRKFSYQIHLYLSGKYGILIPSDTIIGYGLYIAHGGPVVVNHTAKIGHNCNLSQFTTIGSNHERAAVIGDNVYIGPSVCIVENVLIGNNATIGAGSIVVKNVPENTTVAGNPAKVISVKCAARYIQYPWKISF